jgi:sugar phosphate isomerase/epimerase
MQISYSTAGFRNRTLEAALTATAAAGYTHVEIATQDHLRRVPTGAELERLHKHLHRCGLSVGTVHAPMRENVLGAPDEEWRTEKVGVLSEYLHLSGELGHSPGAQSELR